MFNIFLDKEDKGDQVSLNESTLQDLKINSESITLHFGMFTKNLDIVIENTLEPGNIVIPSKLGPEITIPDLPYDYYFENNNLFLGPVIGYIAVPRYYANPSLISQRFKNYAKIKGLIFLFRTATLNNNRDTISGKYFNPVTKKFVDGVFPYPSVIFNRTPLSRKTFNRLKSRIGNNLFNYPFFNTNKWTFWDRMSKVPAILPHLPQTTKFTGIDSLLQALDIHGTVYIKPTNLSQGRGILQVQKLKSNYRLSDRNGSKYMLKSPQQLLKRIQRYVDTNRQYIIQQAIPFINEGGNKIDFRVYIQKDSSKQWKYSAMETKVAKKGSIISNSSNRKLIMPGKKALAEFFGLNEIEVEQKTEEIIELCLKVLTVMETYSQHLGDAAIDLVLDQNHKIWLLEVQLNYAADKKAKRHKDEREVLTAILPTPFEYAKALAGF